MNPSEPTEVSTLFIAVEIGAWLIGVVCCWRLLTGRLITPGYALPRSRASLNGFVSALLLVFAGGILLPQAATYLSNDTLGPAATDGDWWLVVQGTAFQLGLLAGAGLGALVMWRSSRNAAPSIEVPSTTGVRVRRPLLAGTVTFLMALPVIGLVGFAWTTVLNALGVSTNDQEMVDMFRKVDDPIRLAWMMTLAVVLAPLTEELIFRAGLFRYLRTHFPRPIALMVPSLVFALLHGSLTAFVPLFILGVLLAYAYERTGNISVSIIAHGLFNLNTILMIMAGVTS